VVVEEAKHLLALWESALEAPGMST
jgi:hypothetical protein